MLCRNFSRSRLMSSIRIEAITCRNWPKMMSSACFLTCGVFSPSKRIAAFCMTSGSMLMATVKTLGTFTRMFSLERASLQRNFDLDRFQAQVSIVLNDAADEPAAAVNAGRRSAAADFAVDHQDAVARAALVAFRREHDDADKGSEYHQANQ